MKKHYIDPRADVILLAAKDVLTASDPDKDQGYGDDPFVD